MSVVRSRLFATSRAYPQGVGRGFVLTIPFDPHGKKFEITSRNLLRRSTLAWADDVIVPPRTTSPLWLVIFRVCYQDRADIAHFFNCSFLFFVPFSCASCLQGQGRREFCRRVIRCVKKSNGSHQRHIWSKRVE